MAKKGHGGSRLGAGRPTADPKGVRVTFRVAERDLLALETYAKKKGLSVSEAARFLMRAVLTVEQEKAQ